MHLLRRAFSTRRRRVMAVWPNKPLLLLCLGLIAVSMWVRPDLRVSLFRTHRQREPASAVTLHGSNMAVCIKTQTRGLLDLNRGNGDTYLMVQCHRGQFSNRLMCVKAGVVLARTLNRTLVLPVFTDVEPPVDVSTYVSLECLRRSGQAVTFQEFRQQACGRAGLAVPQGGPGAGSSPPSDSGPPGSDGGGSGSGSSGGGRPSSSEHAFCEDGGLLHVDTAYSLADYRDYGCWDRREDITNARHLGVEVGHCTHLAPDNTTLPDNPYSLAQLLNTFGNRSEQVLLFLDLFGVNLLPDPNELAQTVSQPGQMCGWLPTEAAAGAADAVLQRLIPPASQQDATATSLQVSWFDARVGGGLGGMSASSSSMELRHRAAGGVLTAGEARLGGSLSGAMASGSFASGVLPRHHRQHHRRLEGRGGKEEGADAVGAEPSALPPLRLRGTQAYAAVHLRRSDWFYYCGGARRCFYSITEAGLWLNETLSARRLRALYVSTNADAREKDMLRRALAGHVVLFWEDVLSTLRRWQAAAAAAVTASSNPAGDTLSGTSITADLKNADMTTMGTRGTPVVNAGAAAAAAAALPSWLAALPLDDALMVQMVEKSICMQAAFFVSASKSTFSNQILDFRNGGLGDNERSMLIARFGPGAISAAAAAAGVVDGLRPADGFFEPKTPLCGDLPPQMPDSHRLPDAHNPQILLEQLRGLRDWVLRRPAANGPAVEGKPPPPSPTQWGWSLGRGVLSAWRFFERVVLAAEDGHAMAAANRFVDMYTGGAFAGLVLEGQLVGSPRALAACVAAAASGAGAVALHVTMVDVPEAQQVLVMQALERTAGLPQITRMGGADQERSNTFTLLYRGDGLGRHAEPALLEELPTFLPRVDGYVLAKARVLLGDRQGQLYRQVESVRGLFGFGDPRDGACRDEDLRASEGVGADGVKATTQ